MSPEGARLRELSFAVADAEAGERLDRILAVRAGLARSRLVAEAVTVDGSPARLKDRPLAGCRVEAMVGSIEAIAPEPEDVEFDVIWADDDLAVVSKPPGVAVHAPAGDPGRRATLVGGLLARYPEIATLGETEAPERPGVVHRLDRDTSGLLVVARTRRALDALRHMVASRELTREYAALVAGEFEAPAGEIDAPIGRRPGSRTFGVRSGGRESRTRYSVAASWHRPALSALQVWLDTGRTHQIRVHLSAIGHPVVGDRSYRGPTILGADRQFLHAHRLTFTHPFTHDTVDVAAALPEDLRQVLDAAGSPDEGTVPEGWLTARSA